jgi:hypothetical protein
VCIQCTSNMALEVSVVNSGVAGTAVCGRALPGGHIWSPMPRRIYWTFAPGFDSLPPGEAIRRLASTFNIFGLLNVSQHGE